MEFIFHDCTVTELAKAFRVGGFWFGVPTSFYCKEYITAPKFGKDAAVITAQVHFNVRLSIKTSFKFSISSKLVTIIIAIAITK